MTNQNENSSQWIPQPLDLSGIELTPQLDHLSELLAKNIHDMWAQERIRNGWSYGAFRCDEFKQTPCLVPYEALPEDERLYDQIIARQTLQMILSFGFEITPSDPNSHRPTD